MEADTIIADGRIYSIKFHPRGTGAGKGTHISVFIHMESASILNLDLPNTIQWKLALLHESDPKKNYTIEATSEASEFKDNLGWE